MDGICDETRLRIRVSVYAWAYEMHDTSLVDDSVFDFLCRQVDLSKQTSRPDMDKWFIENFNPSTGMWVRQHPEPQGLEWIFQLLSARNTLHSPMGGLLTRLLQEKRDTSC